MNEMTENEMNTKQIKPQRNIKLDDIFFIYHLEGAFKAYLQIVEFWLFLLKYVGLYILKINRIFLRTFFYEQSTKESILLVRV